MPDYPAAGHPIAVHSAPLWLLTYVRNCVSCIIFCCHCFAAFLKTSDFLFFLFCRIVKVNIILMWAEASLFYKFRYRDLLVDLSTHIHVPRPHSRCGIIRRCCCQRYDFKVIHLFFRILLMLSTIHFADGGIHPDRALRSLPLSSPQPDQNRCNLLPLSRFLSGTRLCLFHSPHLHLPAFPEILSWHCAMPDKLQP